jgi:hypothetical protein
MARSLPGQRQTSASLNSGEETAGDIRLQRYHSPYSRFVQLVKYSLPVVAGVVILLVVVWPELKSQPEKFPIAISDLKVETAGGQRVINARFTGVDNENRPFSVTADAVVQDGPDIRGVKLTKPKADVTDGNFLAQQTGAPSYRWRRFVSRRGIRISNCGGSYRFSQRYGVRRPAGPGAGAVRHGQCPGISYRRKRRHYPLSGDF